ncbi:unnamed protein product [Eruca vesicaria subsp. sativa]|uniref:At2g35280-like TPR domain-containing protein n=1 Tax=Eruca vesicaria subsp. sativa TaxID=29727 RepID=A0ABC8M4W9_ERUVS|nr:unnamed protein product [Eruca vesicaria subsp. sativa]
MEVCLKHKNGYAHYVERINQYFGYKNNKKGLKHLRTYAYNNCRQAIYLYAILLLSTGKPTEGMRYMDRL